MKKIFTKHSLILKREYDVIVHIGAPKTGTSAIQNFLLDSRKDLLEEGFYYPYHSKDNNNISGGHSEFASLIVGNDITDAEKLFLKYLSKAKNKTLLLSAESFFHNPDNLFKIMSSYKVKIIVFQRNRVEEIISLYNQGVKRHFQTNKLHDICQDILVRDDIKNIDALIEDWKKKFKPENVEVIPYSKAKFSKQPIQEVFLASLNLSKKVIHRLKPTDIKMINKSYGYAELELKRLLNQVLDRENSLMNNRLDLFLQELSDLKHVEEEMIELSDELLNKLQKKFNIKEVSFQLNNKKKRERYKDIFRVCDLIEEKEKNLYSYLCKCLEVYIDKNFIVSKDIEHLLEWFDVPYDKLQHKNDFFSQSQLNQMIDGKYKEADFLRDIALLLFSQEDNLNALKIIKRAHALRSDGPVIQKIQKAVEEQIKKGKK